MTAFTPIRPLRLFCLAASLALSACAHAPSADTTDADEANDPAESINRKVFAGNQFVDRHLLKPVAQAYLDVVPQGAQHGIHNFAGNLQQPAVLLNDLLQGNISRAAVTGQRFLLDSTLGVGGLFDVATGWGLPGHAADLGQTFGVWGVGTGPSVQLPLLGPSNVRDTVGQVAGIFTNPLGQIPSSTMTDIELAGGVTGLVDLRAELIPATDTLERTSLDYYAALRSLMAQRRAAMIEEGREGKVGGPPVPTAVPAPGSLSETVP